MEDFNKSFDADKMLNDVANSFEKYESKKKNSNVLIRMAVSVLSGLTDILKKIDQKMPDSKIVNRVC